MKYLADVFLILALSAILGCFYFIFRQPGESGWTKFPEMIGRCLIACLLSLICLIVLAFVYFIIAHSITGTD
jgi:hypothetical protein